MQDRPELAALGVTDPALLAPLLSLYTVAGTDQGLEVYRRLLANRAPASTGSSTPATRRCGSGSPRRLWPAGSWSTAWPPTVERFHLMTFDRPTIENYLMDMDGVLVHEERLIPGADLFVKRHQGDPPDRLGGPLHRHQPRPDRALARRAAAGHRGRCRPHLQGYRGPPLLRGQAQPADDARGPAGHRRPHRFDGDDRRPDGHRHRRRDRGRPPDRSGPFGHHQPRRAQRFPFLPSRIVDSVADLVDDVPDRRPGDQAQPGVTNSEGGQLGRSSQKGLA